jgi:hypothetical protein
VWPASVQWPSALSHMVRGPKKYFEDCNCVGSEAGAEVWHAPHPTIPAALPMSATSFCIIT